MTNRILDFSQHPARLRIRDGLLVIHRDGEAEVTVPIGEIAAVILSHPQVTLTLTVLGQMAKNGVAVVCSDEKQRPAGMLLPIEGHLEQAIRFQQQASITVPRRKRLWQAIVKSKISAQGRVLEEFFGTDFGLAGFARRVASGDPGNVEAHAARRYWALLFPEIPFRRSDEEDARNHLLNYGYSVLRAATARSLCASGLHPSFGLHHRSPHNTFPLADDLMEPFRPAVDRIVAHAARSALENGGELGLDSPTKRMLIEVLTSRYSVERESRTLLDVIQRTAQSLAGVISGEKEQFEVPRWRATMRKDVATAVPGDVALRNVRSAG